MSLVEQLFKLSKETLLLSLVARNANISLRLLRVLEL